MDIYLIRHGHTIGNRDKIIQGHEHGKLSLEGKKQAKLLGKHLASMKFDAIVSSDLKRCLQTAKEVANHQKGITIFATQQAREAYLGSYENKPSSEFEKIDWRKPPLDVESFDALIARAGILLKNLKRHYCGKKVALVSHSGLGKAMIHYILGKSEYTDGIGSMKNTSVTHITLEGDSYKIVYENNVDHLPSELITK